VSDLVAVYGTLRYGGRANGLLKGCRRIGTDVIYATLYDLGSFPGVKLGGSNLVLVDVYRLPLIGAASVLMSMDRYEGYNPNETDQCLYRRLKVSTVQHQYHVWVYEYAHAVHEELEIISGDWFHPIRKVDCCETC
jgi:gamma-glutamylcyclotransferase (GGCT)/AIG2-like uncharacterized protein YtfP